MPEEKHIDPRMRIIRDEVLACRTCSLHASRRWPVIGQGSHQADIILVAEAPGATEDKTGRPFCGQAGKVLDQLLEAVSLRREDIYIANILKCHPPGNRNPKPDEIIACTPFLVKQIEIIQPKIIGCLGSFASSFIMDLFHLSEQKQGISKIHGNVFEGYYGELKAKVVPLYHPAVASYNANMLDALKDDFGKLFFS